MLRIAFLGTELSILDTLRQSRCEVACVYLPPGWPLRMVRHKFSASVHGLWSSKASRHRLKAYRAIDRYARKHGLPRVHSSRVWSRAVRAKLRDKGINLGVVANFDQRLPEALLAIPENGFINLHPSLLPAYRGPNPLEYILLNQEPTSGVTWHAVAPEIDAGDILAQEAFDVEPDYGVKDLMRISLRLANQLLPPLLADISAGRAKAIPQDERQASTYPKAGPAEMNKLAAMGKF